MTLREALARVYDADVVDALTEPDLERIEAIVKGAPWDRWRERKAAEYKAETYRLHWTIRAEIEGRPWKSGSLRVVGRDGWTHQAAWLRVVTRSDMSPPVDRWEATLYDLAERGGGDRETMVFGSPTENPSADFEECRRRVEAWFTDRGYSIEREVTP
jgi:hypothetical protein